MLKEKFLSKKFVYAVMFYEYFKLLSDVAYWNLLVATKSQIQPE